MAPHILFKQRYYYVKITPLDVATRKPTRNNVTSNYTRSRKRVAVDTTTNEESTDTDITRESVGILHGCDELIFSQLFDEDFLFDTSHITLDTEEKSYNTNLYCYFLLMFSFHLILVNIM